MDYPKIDGLGSSQFQRFYLNDIPNDEDLLLFNIDLYGMEFV